MFTSNILEMYCVYKLTSKTSGKIYIGLTNNFKHRMNQHKYSKQKYHINMAIRAYGFDDFRQEILIDNLSKEDASLIEILLIAQYNSTNSLYGYNLSSGGESNINPRTRRGFGHGTSKYGISFTDNPVGYRKTWRRANCARVYAQSRNYRIAHTDIYKKSYAKWYYNDIERTRKYKLEQYHKNAAAINLVKKLRRENIKLLGILDL